MLCKTLAVALPLSFALIATAGEAAASNYPPSYDYCGPTTTLTSGSFEIIQNPVRSDTSSLTVAYRGYLRNYYPDNEINIYVRLNGQDAFLAASAGQNGDAYVFVSNAPRDCVWCPAGGGPQYPSSCNGVQLPPHSSGTWICNEPTAIEKHLFQWAYSGYSLNAWDVEVAAESHGAWDSNYGANYSVHFQERNSCF